MLKHIRIIPLVIGIAIGIIIVFFTNPIKTVVNKYPTPETANKLIFKDKNGVCYKYKSNQVDCDKNQSRLKDFPLNK